MMAKRKVLGIDLGTTYSCVAYVNDFGKPEVLVNRDNERTTPSVVWFDGDRAIVGREAKEMSNVYPETVCSFIKRQMGNDDYTFDVDGVKYSPENISSLILRKLVQDAWEQLGEEVRDVVITCPAYFFIKERNATKTAGDEAGLNVLQIVNEPTAAAVSYGFQPGKSGSTEHVLVYDLGGGTFDVTVIRVSSSSIDVVCTDGDHQLGGKDWDDRLALYLADRFVDETGIDVDLTNDAEFYYDLMNQAEVTKKHLSQKQAVSVKLSHAGETVRCDVTRDDFENLTHDLIERTADFIQSCLNVARQKGVDRIDRVILVGGSSRMPQVMSRVSQLFDTEPALFDPDEAVAKGAAIIGNNCVLQDDVKEKLRQGNRSRSISLDNATEEEKRKAVLLVADETGVAPEIVQEAMREVRNVSSKTFGLVSVDSSDREVVSNIIYRNTPIPYESTRTFYTMVDNQTGVHIRLMENMSDAPNDVEQTQSYIRECNELMYQQKLIYDELQRHPFSFKHVKRFDEINKRIENYVNEARLTKCLAMLDTPTTDSQMLWEGELELAYGLPQQSPIDATYSLDDSGLLTITIVDRIGGRRKVQSVQTGIARNRGDFEESTAHCRSLTVE